jgi:hypothetical protein
LANNGQKFFPRHLIDWPSFEHHAIAHPSPPSLSSSCRACSIQVGSPETVCP